VAGKQKSQTNANPNETADTPVASIALLKTIIGWHEDAIGVMDRSLRFIAANAGWTLIFGFSDEQTVGRTLPELLGEAGRKVERDLRRALAGREVIKTFDIPNEGGLRHVTFAPWRDDNGEIGGITIRHAMRDGLRQGAERRERRLSLAMQMAKVFAYEVDFRTGEITYEPFRPDFVVRDMKFHCHEDLLSVMPKAAADCLRDAWERHLATGEPALQEYACLMSDGSHQWLLSCSEAIRNVDNEVVGVAGMTQMIDDRKRAELALVAEKEAAQAADHAKSEFLANVSHEIRTPLNGVLGLASLLQRTALSVAQAEMVATIETSAQTLNTLLSDVLDLAKIESGHMELTAQPFDPVEVVGHLHHLFEGVAAQKGLDFTCDIDASVHGLAIGDRARLSQILINLCSNAIKFTAGGGVAIRARAIGDGDQQQLSFAVSDTGPGISEEALGRLFQRFVQADGSISRSFGGTGLGLAISRTLARLMDGDVEVISKLGQGSTFTLTVHAPRWSGALDESRAETTADGEDFGLETQARVLLVEDHPVNRRVVELILGGMVSLSCAENGAEGLAAFKTQPFDLVLMDMQMPVMDGIEATREIRAFERATARPPTPIIMLSANAFGEHVRRGREAGADSYLAKPITADELVSAVARALNRTQPSGDELLSTAG
jgi:PAS domain S-box-containing protein